MARAVAVATTRRERHRQRRRAGLAGQRIGRAGLEIDASATLQDNWANGTPHLPHPSRRLLRRLLSRLLRGRKASPARACALGALPLIANSMDFVDSRLGGRL